MKTLNVLSLFIRKIGRVDWVAVAIIALLWVAAAVYLTITWWMLP